MLAMSGGSGCGGTGTKEGATPTTTCFVDVLPFVLPFLTMREALQCSHVSRNVRRALASALVPCTWSVTQATSVDSSAPACESMWQLLGPHASTLRMFHVKMLDESALPMVLSSCCGALRDLTVHKQHTCVESEDGEALATAALSLCAHLSALRVHVTNHTSSAARVSPFTAFLGTLPSLCHLRKLTLLCYWLEEVDKPTCAMLAAYLADTTASASLYKIKLAMPFLHGDDGVAVCRALARHAGIRRVTIMRYERTGPTLRPYGVSLLGQALFSRVTTWEAFHLRAVGMRWEMLGALIPPAVQLHPVPRVVSGGGAGGGGGADAHTTAAAAAAGAMHLPLTASGYATYDVDRDVTEEYKLHLPALRSFKLDGNWLHDGDAVPGLSQLLERMPALSRLSMNHVNMMHPHADPFSTCLARHARSLRMLSFGGNEFINCDVAALAASLPRTIEQVYLHGNIMEDEGAILLARHVGTWDKLWALGVNGTPVGDVGVAALAAAVCGHPCLRDIGITCSKMTDRGVAAWAGALASAPALRYVFMYTSGFKAAERVSGGAIAALRAALPSTATLITAAENARYIKHP